MTHERKALIPVSIAVAIAVSVLHGLHAAHEAHDEQGALLGIVHRDVSPQNVIVGSDGVARVIDFGIAKAESRSNVSREGQLKGKLPYMAPEQIQRGVVNRRTDVYGASVLLWELLTGERLFDGEAEGMILGRILDDEVPAPSTLRPNVPPAVDAITLRGLAREQDERFESARAMALELEKAVRPATAVEIAEWVSSLAETSLKERREMLARLEKESARERERESSRNAAAVEDVRTVIEPAVARSSGGLVARVLERALGLLRPSSSRDSR
jgi:serine/threonine-protein kinase